MTDILSIRDAARLPADPDTLEAFADFLDSLGEDAWVDPETIREYADEFRDDTQASGSGGDPSQTAIQTDGEGYASTPDAWE